MLRHHIRLLSVTALGALTASASAHASTTSPWCSAHVLLGPKSGNLTFTCTAPVSRLRLVIPAGAKLSARPRLLLGRGRSSACTVGGRTVTCTGKVAAGTGAGVVLHYRPLPKLGDPILYTATVRGAPIVLHLSIADPDD